MHHACHQKGGCAKYPMHVISSYTTTYVYVFAIFSRLRKVFDTWEDGLQDGGGGIVGILVPAAWLYQLFLVLWVDEYSAKFHGLVVGIS